MTTKEQELKALNQIKKIVESLGEDSYVATAFEGCFEDAELNIENDWACSWKQRAEMYDGYARQWESECGLRAAERDRALQKQRELEKQIRILKESILSDEDMMDFHSQVTDGINQAEVTIEESAKKIVEFADDPSSSEFKTAVETHRSAKVELEYLHKQRTRIRNAICAESDAED